VDRLKTDECVGDATVCLGAVVGREGVEKSNRSPRPELALLDTGAGEIPGAESKAPNPLEVLNVREACGGAGAVFWAGFMSKKLPPLRGGGET